MSWRGDLESAVTFATQAAELAQEYAGRALGFDMAEPPTISASDVSLLMYALGEAVVKCREAEEVFYANRHA